MRWHIARRRCGPRLTAALEARLRVAKLPRQAVPHPDPRQFRSHLGQLARKARELLIPLAQPLLQLLDPSLGLLPLLPPRQLRRRPAGVFGGVNSAYETNLRHLRGRRWLAALQALPC